MQAVPTAPLEQAVERAGAFVIRHIGKAFAERLKDRFDQASEAYGTPIAVQHMRNLVLACSIESGPADLQQATDELRPKGSRRLRQVTPILDQGLIDCFRGMVPHRQREPDTACRKCLLIVNYIPLKSMASHLRLISACATLLATRDATESVTILVTQELSPEGPSHQDGEIDANRRQEWRDEMLYIAGANASAKVQFATPDRLGPVWPYERAIAIARRYDPDLIFAFQGNYRSHVVVDVMRDCAPIVAIQCNSNNPEPTCCDLVLAHGRRPHFDDMPHPALWRVHTIPVVPYEKTERLEGSDFGPRGHLRLVTALGQGRLATTLLAESAALLDRIVAFLAAHENITWVMVGEPDTGRLQAALDWHGANAVKGRLRLLPRVTDLRAVFEHCDIYVHPPGNRGGGMTIAMAVAEGLAVVAPNDNDAANFLPGETLCASADEAFSTLEALASNATGRTALSERQRTFMERNNSFRTASDSLEPLLADAHTNFAARTGPVT